MANRPNTKNIRTQVSSSNLPSPIVNLIVDYLEDDITLEKLNNLKFADVCFRDCQGHNYDDYNRILCRECRSIDNLERHLKTLVESHGKTLFFQNNYIIVERK